MQLFNLHTTFVLELFNLIQLKLIKSTFPQVNSYHNLLAAGLLPPCPETVLDKTLLGAEMPWVSCCYKDEHLCILNIDQELVNWLVREYIQCTSNLGEMEEAWVGCWGKYRFGGHTGQMQHGRVCSGICVCGVYYQVYCSD